MDCTDFFKCTSCKYVTRIRVRGDACTCPKCGKTMKRIEPEPQKR